MDHYTASTFAISDVVVVTGLSWSEKWDRQEDLKAKLSRWTCFFPLNVRPRLNNCEIVEELGRYGLPVSDAYAKGRSHDNCNGGCVLQGQRQWAGLLDDDPEHFAYCERREQAFHNRTGFSALRDRRGGDTKSYPLVQLRIDKERGREFPDDWRSTCSCMYVGEDGPDT